MIAIYCRISREKEAGKDRSINDQKLSGIELAKKLNIPYRVYIDEGISGTLPINERPALSDLISDIYSKEINKVYVYDQSRLERSPEARFILKDLFIKENIQLYTESGLVGKDIEDEFYWRFNESYK
jgi:site-specific DNA recombinase